MFFCAEKRPPPRGGQNTIGFRGNDPRCTNIRHALGHNGPRGVLPVGFHYESCVPVPAVGILLQSDFEQLDLLRGHVPLRQVR